MSLLLIDSKNTQHWDLDQQGIHKKTALVTPTKAFLVDASCHILHTPVPVKQVRQIKKALPFALEEQLACEVEEVHLHFLGKSGTNAYAAVIQHTAMERVKLDFPDLTELYFLPSCLPLEKNSITTCLIGDQALIRFDELNACSLPTTMLAMMLSHHIEKNPEQSTLQFYQDGGDYDLLHSQLESLGFVIQSESVENLIGKIETKTDLNLLSGPYFVAPKKIQGKNSKFKLPLTLAASLFICSLVINVVQTQHFSQLAEQTQQASKRFYKTLFPNERIIGIKRQFRDKLESAGGSQQGSTTGFTDLLAKAGAVIKTNNDLDMHNVRYSIKKNQLELEIWANSIAQLDKLKQQLEGKKMKVEIASANNTSAKKVKGVLKVSSNG